jgi:hypothetical protein
MDHGSRSAVSRAAVLVLAAVAIVSCASVNEAEHQAALERNRELETRIAVLEQELAIQQNEIAALENQVDGAREVDGQRELALQQLGELRANRRELIERIEELETAIISGSPEAIASLRLSDTAATAESRVPRTPEGAMADALAGGGGFLPVATVGLENEPRVAARFAARAPGIAADRVLGVPRLFDARPDYEETLTYLTIIDPAGTRPRLRLTSQYISSLAPLYLRTVFISIEGVDPVDPIDPIVLAGDASRQTDGEVVREALSVEADDDLVNRLSQMLSSARFSVTFVGIAGQQTYSPSVAERSAMSNILFAYFDLRR